MSYAQAHIQTRDATKVAQRAFAEIMGMPLGATGNALLKSLRVVVVYGPTQVVEQMMPGGAYQKREILSATMTKDQVDNAPTIKDPFTRTDVVPNVVYRIESVEVNSPFIYTMVLSKLGI